jgi:hypothetical protein
MAESDWSSDCNPMEDTNFVERNIMTLSHNTNVEKSTKIRGSTWIGACNCIKRILSLDHREIIILHLNQTKVSLREVEMLSKRTELHFTIL